MVIVMLMDMVTVTGVTDLVATDPQQLITITEHCLTMVTIANNIFNKIVIEINKKVCFFLFCIT
jgi:hypothetical protein